MRHVREILRLSLDAGLSTRVVGERVGVGPTTVRDTLKRFGRSGLSWPVPAQMTDANLAARLYGVPGVKAGRRKQPEPDWSVVARELKRKHVTLQVLWEEYIAARPDGYRYSRWCDLFRRWEGRLPLVMRQSHAGGEKMFVDYAGDTAPVVVDRRHLRRRLRSPSRALAAARRRNGASAPAVRTRRFLGALRDESLVVFFIGVLVGLWWGCLWL